MNQQLYWTNKGDEEESINNSAIDSALLELLIIIDESIKSGHAKFEDFLTGTEFPKKDNEKILSIVTTKGKLRRVIDSNLKITEVAKYYGLKLYKGNKIICPFHNDTDPSLSLSDNKNVFFCFGCRASGDIIEFVKRLEEWKEKKQ